MNAFSKRLPTLDEVRRAKAFVDFSYFMDYDSGFKDVPGRHLDVLDKALQDVSDGRIKRLIVTMPPRHGKSERVSKKFPAWHLGRNPDDEIILASYSIDLARDHSRIARDTLEKNMDVFGVALDSDRKSAESWGIEGHRGGLNAAGVGGPITGRGARIGIIDDPFKNAEEAASEVIREKVWQWYQSTFYTRLTPDGRIIIVMTRWHEDDLVGRLLRKEREEIENGTHTGERWTVINLPAIAEENDYLGREPGEALWPEFGFDLKRLEEIKKEIGSYFFNALYQQRPSAADGGMFRRSYFRYFREEKGFFVLQKDDGVRRVPIALCRWFQTIDTALKTKTTNDYTVIATWCVTPDKDLLLYDVFRERLEVPEQWPAVQRMRQRFPQIVFQAVEDKASGTGLIQTAKRAGKPLRILKADTDKVARAVRISVMYENGMVYHKENAPWLDDYENELLQFPNGAHDDQVDVASYAGMEAENWSMKWPEPQIDGFYTPTEMEDLGLKKFEIRKVK